MPPPNDSFRVGVVSRGVAIPELTVVAGNFLIPVSTRDVTADRSGVDFLFGSMTCFTERLSLKCGSSRLVHFESTLG